MDQYRRAILIPAFNEETSIAQVVTQAKAFGDVVVVNDGSRDQTATLAEQAGAIVVNKQNGGYEKALETGFQFLSEKGYQYVVTFDADGQHDSKMLDLFFKQLLENKADLILGVRPHKARFSEVLMGLYFQSRFGVKDILCGMKGYNIKLFNNYGHFDTLGSIGAELTLVSLKRGAKMLQVNVPIAEREGDSRFGLFLHGNYKILKSLFKLCVLDLNGTLA